MKSIHGINKNNNSFLNPKIYTEEIIQFLKDEGFKESKNDSYCNPHHAGNSYEYWEALGTYGDYEHSCLEYRMGGQYSIGIYIFDSGIGLDIDLNCGGNMHNRFWLCEDTEDFKKNYDSMVEDLKYYK